MSNTESKWYWVRREYGVVVAGFSDRGDDPDLAATLRELAQEGPIERVKTTRVVIGEPIPADPVPKSRPLKMGEIQSGTRVRHKTWPLGADELVTRTSEFGVYRWLIWTTWEQLAQDFQMWIEDRWIDCKVQE